MIKYKLLGVDLDGTLLTPFKHISRTDMKSLKDYQTLGGNFVLCTGRSINSAFTYSRLIDNKMNTTQKFIIACCGSYIVNLSNSTAKEFFIPDNIVRKIHNHILTTNGKISLWAYTKESVDNNSVLVTKHIFNNIVKIFKSSKLIPLVETIEELSSYKLNLLCVSATYLRKTYDWLVANVSNDVDISFSNPHLIEITPKGVNKQTALEYVAKQLKIPQTQVAYIGDSDNDTPALKWAPLSVAVGRNKKLIEAAKYHIQRRKNCVTVAVNKYIKDEALGINLVATDLDGTLFDNNTAIVPSTLHLIEKFINEKNGFFTIASGRNLADILLVLDEIETDKTNNLFAISCNGAAVYDIANRKCIFSKTIDVNVVKEIVDLFNSMFANKQDNFLEVFMQYGDSTIFNRTPLNSYVINREAQSSFYQKYSPHIAERYWAARNQQTLTNEVIDNQKVLKILITIQDHDERARMIAALDKFKERVTICSSSGFNIEINALHVSKGSALEILCHYLSVDIKATIAVGDNYNDIPMLELSPYSVTMSCAKEKVKKAAHYVFDVQASEIVGTAIEKIAFNKNNEQ